MWPSHVVFQFQRISDDEGREKVLAGILDVIQAKGGAAFDGLTPKAGQFIAPNVFVAVFKGILVTIRFEDSHELIALNIEYMHKEEDAQPLFSFEVPLTATVTISNWQEREKLIC